MATTYILLQGIIHGRDETILQYIDILQYLLQQYNTIQLKGNINILHIAIYCDILQYIAMFVALMLLVLNHYTTKMTGPLETWIIHFSFLCFYTVIQGVYSFLYCQNPYSHMKCLLPKSNQILQYGNIL